MSEETSSLSLLQEVKRRLDKKKEEWKKKGITPSQEKLAKTWRKINTQVTKEFYEKNERGRKVLKRLEDRRKKEEEEAERWKIHEQKRKEAEKKKEEENKRVKANLRISNKNKNAIIRRLKERNRAIREKNKEKIKEIEEKKKIDKLKKVIRKELQKETPVPEEIKAPPPEKKQEVVEKKIENEVKKIENEVKKVAPESFPVFSIAPKPPKKNIQLDVMKTYAKSIGKALAKGAGSAGVLAVDSALHTAKNLAPTVGNALNAAKKLAPSGSKLASAALGAAKYLVPGGKALSAVKHAYNIASALNDAYQNSQKKKKRHKSKYIEKLQEQQKLYENKFKSKEHMIYMTRQANRKRHVKMPISPIKFWDNMREFEKQVQLQTMSQVRDIWDKNLVHQIENKKAEEIKLDALDKERHSRQNRSIQDAKIERIIEENPELRVPLEKYLRERPPSRVPISDADYLLSEAKKRQGSYFNKALLYRQDAVNYKLQKEHPEVMNVGIAPTIGKESIRNALASKTNYIMLDNPAFLQRGDQTFNFFKDMGAGALDFANNLLRAAVRYYGNGDRNAGINELTKKLSSVLGIANMKDINNAIHETTDTTDQLRNKKLDKYKNQVTSFNRKFGEGVRNFLNRVGVEGADKLLLQDIILNKWDMTKTPLENLRDIDELKDYVFRNINNPSLLDDLEINSKTLTKMFKETKNTTPEARAARADIAAVVGNKALNTAVDVGSMALDGIAQFFRKGYSFVTDKLDLKTKLDKIIEEYMARPDVALHFRETKDYHDAMAREFALTFLGDPTLKVTELPEDNPYRKIFEAHKGNKEAKEELAAIGLTPDKVKRRMKAINEYSVLKGLEPHGKDQLFNSYMFQTDENFAEAIEKPLSDMKREEKIENTIDFTGNVISALSELQPHLRAIKYNTEKDFTRHMEKQEETYEQSLTNLAEDIVKEVDGKAIPRVNGTGWLKNPMNSEKDRRRNLAVNRLASSLLDIGLYTKDNLMNWFRAHKDDYQKGGKNFLSIDSELPEDERAKLTDNMIRDYKHYVAQEDIPLITHHYNDNSNNPMLNQPQGRITPATLAYLRHEYRQSRPGFKHAKENTEEQKKYKEGSLNYNYLESQAVNNIANAMMETDYFSEMLNRYENLPHAMMAFSKEELSEFTPQKLKELNEATIGMNPSQIAEYLYRDVKRRRADSYDTVTKRYKPFDFSGAKEFRNHYFHENKGNVDDGNPPSHLFATSVAETNYNLTPRAAYTQNAEIRNLHAMTERKFKNISKEQANEFKDFVFSPEGSKLITDIIHTPRPRVKNIPSTPPRVYTITPKKNSDLDEVYSYNESMINSVSKEPQISGFTVNIHDRSRFSAYADDDYSDSYLE